MRAQLFRGGIVWLLWMTTVAASESFEFVGEHLPETAIDNRYGSLPLATQAASSPQLILQLGQSHVESQRLVLAGDELAIGYQHPLSRGLGVQLLAFDDRQRFSGGNASFPLEVLFSKDVPLALPADADYGALSGRYRHRGLGLFIDRPVQSHRWGWWHAAAGLLWEELLLDDYRMPFTLTSGPSRGATGVSDYSGRYRFITPVLQLAQQHLWGRWSWTPKLTIALPLPRRGVQGRISSSGFDIAGDTDRAGNGKHYGDFSMTLGLLVAYRPWHLSLNLGELASQMLLEPLIHKGIETSRIVSLRWTIRW